jgi:hypothetical protein
MEIFGYLQNPSSLGAFMDSARSLGNPSPLAIGANTSDMFTNCRPADGCDSEFGYSREPDGMF